MTKNDLADKLVPVFWLSLLGAVVAGFVAPPGTSRWIAIGYVGLVGLFVSLANWAIIIAVAFRKRSSSMAPLLGGLLLSLAIGAIPVTSVRVYALLGFVIDPWMPAMAWSLLSSFGRK